MTTPPPTPSVILVVQAASPRIPGTPDTGAEYREIHRSITHAQYSHALTLESLQAARARDLPDRLIRGAPAVLHFSARGTPGGGLRFLTDDDGGGEAPISDQGLCKLLTEFVTEGLRLVVLSACWTSELAHLLATTVPCVIGTGAPITDTGCLDYSRTLYTALAHGRSIGKAHSIAVGAAEMYGADTECLPALRTAPDVYAEALHLVGAEYRTPPTRTPIKPQGSGFSWRLRKKPLPRGPNPQP
ncbi:CHAT domain-containing protein [Streptomyces sp. NBC_00140]|uniref:CHAT domain-containing protein n=1 Tax=Streptomyces sp. NBC_00140 TaxID=2975664 RepID=UPI0022543892|nr:CHAT domain-containing protein [Streptomyces sp. NBC_00140]MCX5334689.1 CHAT domain-containing protein [Streptomyces sp. NBC_00140]